MEDLIKAAKDAYNQGYKEGCTDGVNQMRRYIIEFTEQISKSLIEATEEAITDKKASK